MHINRRGFPFHLKISHPFVTIKVTGQVLDRSLLLLPSSLLLLLLLHPRM
jgi:hypothetical protein